MLDLSFPKPSLAQREGRKVLSGLFCFCFCFFYLGSLGLIFLLGILQRLQVVSGTVIVHKFPTPLGNSFLAQR